TGVQTCALPILGELLALKWSDIDFEAHTLRVSKTYYNPNNNKRKLQLLTPKTEKSIRTISPDELVVNLLLDYKQFQDELKQDNSRFYNVEDFIFTNIEADPKTLRLVGMRIERLINLTKNHIDLTPHSSRHTNTSLLIEGNVHIKRAMSC